MLRRKPLQCFDWPFAAGQDAASLVRLLAVNRRTGDAGGGCRRYRRPWPTSLTVNRRTIGALGMPEEDAVATGIRDPLV